MSDYMRKVLLCKREKGKKTDALVTPLFLKAERRKQVLTLTIFWTHRICRRNVRSVPFTAQAESGSVSPADGSLFDKNGTTVCNLFLPDDETVAHADAVAGIGIGRNGAYWAGQLPCFYECQAGGAVQAHDST